MSRYIFITCSFDEPTSKALVFSTWLAHGNMHWSCFKPYNIIHPQDSVNLMSCCANLSSAVSLQSMNVMVMWTVFFLLMRHSVQLHQVIALLETFV